MGFLDGLCDSPDGEAKFSWHDFWRLDNVCSLTTLGAVVAGLVALLSFVAMLVHYGCSSSGGGGCRATGYANKLWNGVNDGGGREETKGNDADDYGGGNFASSAAEPLLAGHDSSAAGAGGDGDDIANSFFGVVAATTDENDHEAGKVGGAGGKKTPKKGTGVHWLKLLLYWIQAGYHLSVGAFTLVDGHADNNPYKYVSFSILILAWTVHCCTECVHHAMMGRRRNPVYQVIFPTIAFGTALWILLRTDGFGGVDASEPAAWDLGLLLLIVAVEIWSCIRVVPIKYYYHLTPEYSSSIWSMYNFNWYTRVIDRGYKGELKMEQLPEIVDDDRAETIWARYAKLLYPRGQSAVLDGEELDVGRNIVRLGGKRYFLQAATALVGALTQLVSPLALNQITDYMDTYDKDAPKQGIPLVVVASVAGLFLGQGVANYCDATMFKLGRRMGIRSRSALISAVFRKAMALDMSSAHAGQLQNHISVDAEAVLNLMVFQMFMWSALVRLVSCIILLFWVLGVSAISGLSLVFLSLPLNKVLVEKLKAFQLELMKRRDDRMSVVNEAMNGVRIIKLFAWEPNFLKKMVDARSLEMVLLRTYMFTLGCFMVVVKASPNVIGTVTFLVHTKLLGYPLTAATGFTALALFNQLRMPLIVLPDTLNYYIQARVSFRRIESFLSRSADDVRNEEVYGKAGSDRHSPDLASGEIKIQNGSFRWRQSLALSRPTLSNINLEIKPKQLVCVYGATGAGKSSLLMACLQELVTVEGRSLMNGSVSYASQRAWIQNATVRDNILFGCAFDPRRYDMVLEACALESDLEILDSGDQTEIGEKGVNLSGGQQQRVSLARAVYADSDIVLLDDVLSAVDAHVGKHIFDKCIRKVLKFKTVVLVTHQVNMSAPYADKIVVLDGDGTIKEQGTYEELTAQGEGRLTEVIEASGAKATLVRQSSDASVGGDDKDTKDPRTADSGKKIIEVEKRAVGRPKLALFTTYFRYCGGLWFGIFWAGLSALWQGLSVAQSFTLKDMARSVFGAPVSWYDATPLGRIFNRFSSDIITLDKDLMNDVSSYSDMLLGVVGVVVVIATAIPALTVAMIPVLGLCYYYSNRYLQTSRQLKRLEAVTRSPLYAHFGESVSGVATIRAYEAEKRFIQGNEDRVNNLNRAHFSLWCSNYWLTNRVRMIGAAVCALVGGFLVGSVSSVDGSTAGLVITYSLNFTLTIVFTVRLHAQMEMSVNSIERLDEYCKLPQEAPAVIPDRRPPSNWPSAGEVDIKNLTLKYASSNEPVLHGLTFHVPPRTRVGIVGRTGAGKSSLMNALFRMVEPMPGSSVVVDGEDVLRMGLQDLRRRSNIDPFDDYSDSDIWDALGRCRLHDFVAAQELKLQHAVSAEGSNLSVGQRQLMCMARALLRRAAVLVMDEATANVDPETDALIQEAMKEGFGDCTILCIAHRLHTVAFYDRVLVLDQGQVAEYDTPLALLQDPYSQFRGMCEKAGDLEGLKRVAQEAAAKSSGSSPKTAAAAEDPIFI
ncbi:conserved unknown protein [Ectocarpus siliculosus]|uniref:Uncharacterized protein n=1 Tax=Ectocarpus siliculosus TaxID=2880 RepID=D7G0B6_ECTSI|nr:conserved unknown protein [Ectocarpus siliculosus]|eukprot:CBJ26643.1 conserved unknown protein [Ectocarpus siliculosus]